MEEKRGGSMRDTFGLHRMDEAQIIHVARHVREKFGDPMSRLAMPGKIPQRLHHALQAAPLAGVGDHARVVESDHFSVLLLEERLVIERVDVAWTALHEKEDDALRTRAVMWLLGSEGIL